MSVADLDQFLMALVEYCVIVGGAFIAALLVYLFMSE